VPLVFVTLDPEHDTPQRLAAFTARLPGPVLALTGSQAAVARAAGAFDARFFAAALCGGGTSITHSGAAYLVGRGGRLAAIITEREDPASARAKLRALAASFPADRWRAPG
jgi:protein SCO1/2